MSDPAAAEEPTPDPPFLERRFAEWLGAKETYTLVQSAMLRMLGLVYAVAFLVALRQGPPLIGEHGLLPAPVFLARVHEALGGSTLEASLRLPTLFWLGFSDVALVSMSAAGVLLGVLVLLGLTNAGVQLVLWLLYLSITHVGQRFYGYGWESQLLETGFLSVFLCPLGSLRPFTRAPPFVTLVLSRWLIARIMLGAGLIKIRGDACWTELTCLDFHYETQPIPHPLSPYFHAMPAWFHRGGVLANHLVELGAPFVAFGPRRARLFAGVAFVAFQGTLIASGNLSFLNWLTIVPALACFDDRALAHLLPRRVVARLAAPLEPSLMHARAANVYAVLVAVLSINPVINLLSPSQSMNQSFDPLHLVNTYGAFGSVGRVRNEVVLEGTTDARPTWSTAWREYELPCKPGDVQRPHCWITPYHRRLDWQMWFAALGSPEREPWIVHLVAKLLQGDRSLAPLFAKDPFEHGPPRWVQASLYRYEMVDPQSGERAYWRRHRLGTYLRPLDLGDPALAAFLAQHGWPAPDARSP